MVCGRAYAPNCSQCGAATMVPSPSPPTHLQLAPCGVLLITFIHIVLLKSVTCTAGCTALALAAAAAHAAGVAGSGSIVITICLRQRPLRPLHLLPPPLPPLLLLLAALRPGLPPFLPLLLPPTTRRGRLAVSAACSWSWSCRLCRGLSWLLLFPVLLRQ